MSRLEMESPGKADIVLDGLYKDLTRRVYASPTRLCPIEMSRVFLELCHAQSCGNVSMDAVRIAKRLGAKKVSIVYRRRVADMTALPRFS